MPSCHPLGVRGQGQEQQRPIAGGCRDLEGSTKERGGEQGPCAGARAGRPAPLSWLEVGWRRSAGRLARSARRRARRLERRALGAWRSARPLAAHGVLAGEALAALARLLAAGARLLAGGGRALGVDAEGGAAAVDVQLAAHAHGLAGRRRRRLQQQAGKEQARQCCLPVGRCCGPSGRTQGPRPPEEAPVGEACCSRARTRAARACRARTTGSRRWTAWSTGTR